MSRVLLALTVAVGSAAALMCVAASPAPVIVKPYSAHLQAVVGNHQFLVTEGSATIGWCDVPQHAQSRHGVERLAANVKRDGERFVSTRDDIDVTWSHVCPE